MRLVKSGRPTLDEADIRVAQVERNLAARAADDAVVNIGSTDQRCLQTGKRQHRAERGHCQGSRKAAATNGNRERISTILATQT